jgi:hypothetical protein
LADGGAACKRLPAAFAVAAEWAHPYVRGGPAARKSPFMVAIEQFLSRGTLIAAVLVTLVPAPSALAQTGPIKLVPHRAIYDLSLGATRGNSQIAAVRGRIVYDFEGSACEGYTLQFRQVSELDTGEGKTATSDLRSTTWEAGDAKSYKFNSDNYLNGNLSDSVDGKAEHDANGTSVTLAKPEDKNFHLAAGIVFPTEHMVRAINAGRERKTILDFPVFDGSENGQKVYNTLTVVGQKIAPEERKPDDATADQPALAGVARWPVTISYFDKDKAAKSGEQTPNYSIGFELYENGISRALTLDYNDFVVAGKMTSLEIMEAKPCP